jgi:hypothetical protein
MRLHIHGPMHLYVVLRLDTRITLQEVKDVENTLFCVVVSSRDGHTKAACNFQRGWILSVSFV